VILGVIIGYRPDGGAPGVIAAVALVIAFGLSLSWLWAGTALLVRNPATVMSLGLAVLLRGQGVRGRSSVPQPPPPNNADSGPPSWR
jgi:hypothetical protein